MAVKKGAARPVPAGETRSEFGAALDKLLPYPQQRERFRRWRHVRPFWGGLFAIVGGCWIISYPLGPMAEVVALGAAGLTGIVIGLILIVGGLFFWFAPHQRMFVAIVLMLCSVLSLVATNLGGFFVGMLLGMLGSSLAFGWRQPGLPPRPRPHGDQAGQKTLALAAVGAMLAALAGIGAPENAMAAAAAQSDRPEGRPPLPRVGCGPTNVKAATLNAKNVQIRGVERIQDGCGNTIEVVDLYIPSADLKGYQVTSPGGTFQINTDLHIERIELETPQLTASVDLGALLAGEIEKYLGIKVPLPDISGPVPITPALVGTLDSLGVLPYTLRSLDATNATWIQPIIRGGDVELIGPQLKIVGDPPAIG